ncbi:MAG: hypothetical protein PHG05_03475 [Candidatus Nanoarchaeia archaeon]|nr:hypothetical protein [Candidatus Nanoarchaeia archaeon]
MHFGENFKDTRERYAKVKPLKSAITMAIIYFIVFSLIDFILYNRFLILSYLFGTVIFFLVYYFFMLILNKWARKSNK